MKIDRRNLAAAGALGLLAAHGFANTAAAEGDDAAVKNAVDDLRKAIFSQDKAKLEGLTATQISYGHSDGRVENKQAFIDGQMNRKPKVKSLEFPELSIAVIGDAAIARHIYLAESELDGKETTTKIGALQVWQKQGGSWKLLARQGFKLA